MQLIVRIANDFIGLLFTNRSIQKESADNGSLLFALTTVCSRPESVCTLGTMNKSPMPDQGDQMCLSRNIDRHNVRRNERQMYPFEKLRLSNEMSAVDCEENGNSDRCNITPTDF